jgi:cell division protein FtsB
MHHLRGLHIPRSPEPDPGSPTPPDPFGPAPEQPELPSRATVRGSPPDDPQDEAVAVTEPSLAALPIAGITRRRVAVIVGALLAAWIVIVFARQVGEAAAASARAEAIAAENEQVAAEVTRLQAELDLIQRQEYILQQARGLGFGSNAERPFRLTADAPPLSPNAPGSGALRLGHDELPQSPLDSWLSLLFGPGPTD